MSLVQHSDELKPQCFYWESEWCIDNNFKNIVVAIPFYRINLYRDKFMHIASMDWYSNLWRDIKHMKSHATDRDFVVLIYSQYRQRGPEFEKILLAKDNSGRPLFDPEEFKGYDTEELTRSLEEMYYPPNRIIQDLMRDRPK